MSIQKADGTTKHFFQEDLLKHYRDGNSAFKLIFPNQESAQQHINDFKASQFEDGRFHGGLACASTFLSMLPMQQY